MDRRLNEMSSARVLVVGDLILDRYWHGPATRISPEAPVPVVRVRDVEERLGGAANVAANVASLGARCTLVGVVGDDSDGERLLALCRGRGIVPDFVVRRSEATTVKLRVVSQHQQLIRLDFEQDAVDVRSEAVLERAERHLDACDIVVVSDYAKGSVTRVPDIIAAAERRGVPVVIDPKGADFSRYAGAALITPNWREFEAAAGAARDDEAIVRQAVALCRKLDIGAALVTRGEAGMSLVPREGQAVHLRAEARDVFDVTGAGDTVCAVVATALAAGNDLIDAVRLANVAAGLVVGRLGTATVEPRELDAALVRRASGSGVLDREGLLEAVVTARRRGESVVMTNGCFDVLHAGHVRCLQEAASLGDRLVVAVNDDRSVRALKGDGRPVNPLDARLTVLAALGAVDWVVPFEGETPAALIAEVLPDVLVKGGDYAVEEIAGADAVLAAGGRVLTLTYHEGHSTSAMLSRAPVRDDAAS